MSPSKSRAPSCVLKAGIVIMAGLSMALAIAACGRPKATMPPPTASIEFRFAEESPGEGLEKYVDEDTGETLYLQQEVIIAGRQIAGVGKAGNDREGWDVFVQFTDQGAKDFADATGNHIGKRLGIVIDGHLISAPMIMARVSGGSASLSGQMTEAQVDHLIDLMYGKGK